MVAHPPADMQDAVAQAMEDQVLLIYLAGIRNPQSIAKLIAREESGSARAKASDELKAAVKDTLKRQRFYERVIWSKFNMSAYIRLTALKASASALRSVIGLSQEKNPDKRTRTTNAQFLLSAAAELSPTQKHEMGANEEFLTLFKQMFPSLATGKTEPEAE